MNNKAVIEKLKSGGVRNPLLTKMPWGVYWNEDTEICDPITKKQIVEPQDMRDGHIDADGSIFEWPGNCGKPVAFSA